VAGPWTYAFVDAREVDKVLVLARSALLVLLGALLDAVLAVGVALERHGAARVALVLQTLLDQTRLRHGGKCTLCKQAGGSMDGFHRRFDDE